MKNNTFCILLGMTLLTGLLSCGKDDTPGSDPDPVEKVYHFNDTMAVDGRARTFLVNLPPDYYESSGFSLVIAMHGGGGSSSQFETSSGLSTKANASKFIVVYPDGVENPVGLKYRTWNAGGCCAYAAETNVDDVKFLGQLVDQLIAKYKINPKKVYATGHSNGGMMSYRLACELSSKFAAIAPNGCTMVVKQPCMPSRAVPILHMHSAQDQNVPYQGGIGTSGPSDHYNPPLDSVFAVWSARNSCGVTNQVVVNDSKYLFSKWSSCAAGSEIQYYLTTDGGHAWPGGLPGSAMGDTPSTYINANDLLWEFFQRFSLP
ncbi:MAG: phospholipase [Chitinophagaceae bacterium]|nr:MAG: phospholipase [Chitinophagaceae bacterium]